MPLQMGTMASVQLYMFKPYSDTETQAEQTEQRLQPRLEQDVSEC